MSDAEEITVQVGEILGDKYEVTRLIGRGGMGAVVEARHLHLGELVALKVLHPRYLDNAEAIARFEQEARAAVQIRGTHSARLIDVGKAPTGAPFLVMELLTGEDLAALLARGPQPVEQAVSFILQACEGMAEVHAHGIVHRDLKPGNLFLTTAPDGSPLIKVLDFGIAKNVARDPAIGTLTMTLVALGTPLYMAPEQIRSSRTVDARADVWSLGAILYELLSGEAAFGGNTVAHITAQVLESEPMLLTKIRPDIPHGLEAAVQRALAKDVDKRWVDVAALAAALAPYASGGAASAARAARILSLGIFTSDTPSASTLDAADVEMPGTGRFVARRRRSRMLVGGALAAAVGVLGFGLASASPWEPAEPGRVVAVAGVRNVALQRIGYASMTARLAGPQTRATGPVPAAAAPGDATAPASSTAPAASSALAATTPPAPSAAQEAVAPTKIEPPPQLPPNGPKGKPRPPGAPPKEAPTPPVPPPAPPPPQPKFDPLGERK